MAWGAAIAALAGTVYSANKQDKAAKRQQKSLENSQREAGARAEQARQDALNYYGQAFDSLGELTPAAIAALVQGNATTADILSNYTSVANSILDIGADEYKQNMLGVMPVQQVGGSQLPSAMGGEGQATSDTLGRRLPYGMLAAEEALQGGELAAQRALLSGADVARGDLLTGADYATSALRGGTQLANQELKLGRDIALDDIRYGYDEAGSQLRQGLGQAQQTMLDRERDQLSALRSGFRRADLITDDASDDLMRGFRRAGRTLEGNYEDAIRAQQEGFRKAGTSLGAALGSARGISAARGRAYTADLNPYSEAGKKALARELALSGAEGMEAQQAAYDEFIESPGQKFLRERQEQSLLRNQAAIGGLGGGNVRTALQEQAMGIAAQDLQREISNLQSLAGRGQQAATSISDLKTRASLQNAASRTQANIARANLSANIQSRMSDLAAQTGLSESALRRNLGDKLSNLQLQQDMTKFGLDQRSADLARQLGISEADLISATGGNLANLQTALGQGLAGLETQQAGLTSNLRTSAASQLANNLRQQGMSEAQIESALGGNLANIATATGQNIASGERGLGQQLGGMRMGTGQALADQLAGVRGQQALNLGSLGSNLGRLTEQEGLNISNILQNLGAQRSSLLTGLGGTLANIGVGQSSQIAGMGSSLAQASGLRDLAQANKVTTIANQLGQLAGQVDWGSMGSGSRAAPQGSGTATGNNNAITTQQFIDSANSNQGAGFWQPNTSLYSGV